jgi:hypothetical protein
MRLFVRGYKGQGFGSGFIKWFTRSEYSHVSLVFHMHGEPQEIEAIQGRGVIAHAPHKACHKEFVEYAVPISNEQIVDVHISAMSLIGAKYDWRGVFSFILHRKKHSLDHFFCSEFDAYTLLKGRYPLSRREPYKETPDSIMQSFRLIAPADEMGGA